MLVNDNSDVDTLGSRLSPLLCRGSVNSPNGLWTVNHVAKRFYLVERTSKRGCASSTHTRTTRRRYTGCR